MQTDAYPKQTSTPSRSVNVGCGMSPTHGWINFDNSPSARLTRFPFLLRLARSLKLLTPQQSQFMEFCLTQDIRYADATRRIPLPNESVLVVYSSHMIEHLHRTQVSQFLQEVQRVLVPNGTIRLAAPDLRRLVNQYVEDFNADKFLEKMLIEGPALNSLMERIRTLLFGFRHHQWMYDADSLAQTLRKNGFKNIKILAPGETTISSPDSLNLYERSEESIYVEGRKV